MLAAPLAAEERDFESFAEFLEQFRKDSGTPALSAVIVKDGDILWEGYFGTYDDEGDLPTQAETTYKIASVTKPIASTAILAEMAAEDLPLDTPMSADGGWKELCEYFITTPIPFMSGGEDKHGNSIAPMDCERPTTVIDMLRMRANGADFVYNPIAFARIDRAITGAGGRDLRTIVRERVATPSGMQDTALGWRDPDGGAALRYLAEPFHVIDGRAVKQPLPDDDFRAAAGIIASPRSIAAFDIAFDTGGLLFGPDEPEVGPGGILDKFIADPIGPLGDYRFGWFLEDWEGQRLMWHSGWNEKQYSALYLKVPAKRLTLIVMANTEAVWWGNSVVKAEVVESPIARRFLESFAQ
ncbi:serine hydrolase domain-containing protein [uncultured Erythrobacter sp.]|uniref:serine hydrolase domain-containing protein n=1 Tax=uncultured Erythrobacter sp. TaxID=263913 RepID=UPI00261CAEF0|nr:serine hydrolase domain-containing protein [uncultured Erythrobacter sp.]